MIRRILLELILFLLPFVIFFFYRAASRTMSIRDRWPLTRLILAGAVLAAAALVITPLLEPSAQGKCYRPPRYANGQEIPGGYVDCKELEIPNPEVGQPSERPVAPRDRTPDS